ncbi:MAG: low molecular weight protein-tyrosine-phosphatase [Brachymonas sp.]|nr:low molecular weight protein-tyrosine-phosphatase [Brachymonas sp.]
MTPHTTQQNPVRVLMVCMGNICRSPTAQGVLEHLVEQQGLQNAVQVDSAGTHSYHIGHPPDARSQQQALERGYDLSAQRARQLQRRDFDDFDWVLVMDDDNENRARALCPPEQQHKIRRLASFCQQFNTQDVPDPYYGGREGFEEVLDLCEDACSGFLAFLHTQKPIQS